MPCLNGCKGKCLIDRGECWSGDLGVMGVVYRMAIAIFAGLARHYIVKYVDVGDGFARMRVASPI